MSARKPKRQRVYGSGQEARTGDLIESVGVRARVIEVRNADGRVYSNPDLTVVSPARDAPRRPDGTRYTAPWHAAACKLVSRQQG